MSTHPDKPDLLKHNCIESRVLEQKVWRRCNIDNQHFMAAVVGREGSGKSYTALRIAEVVDPTFNADRVMFEPQRFLEKLTEWKEDPDVETKGKAIVADESGVGLGVRTWYQDDQVLFNQCLQVIRDENMCVLFTLPRLSELDSQARGRLHAFLEMSDLDAGRWAELRWLNWDPSRNESDKIYRHYPKMDVGGYKHQIRRLKLGPPSDTLVAEYSERKDKFQNELYQDAIDTMDETEDQDDDQSPAEIADSIIDENDVGDCLSWHGAHKKWYVSKDLIRSHYDLSHSDAQAVKQTLSDSNKIDIQAIGKKENTQG